MPVLVGLAFVVGLVLLLDCVRLVGGVVAYDLQIQNIMFWSGCLRLVVGVRFCLLVGRLKLPGLHGLAPLSVLEKMCVWVSVVVVWFSPHFCFRRFLNINCVPFRFRPFQKRAVYSAL